MPQAARVTDPIGHSPALSWLVAGLLIGAAIAVAAVAVVGTGGLAAAAIIGGAAAGGAGIGEMLSGMSWAPKDVTGMIIGAGVATNVFTNDLPAARAHIDLVSCSKHSGTPPIAEGSDNVFINNQPAARVDDKSACSAVITEGSPNVFIGGGTAQTDAIHPEDLVPGWVHAALFAVGGAAAVVLGGPIVAAVGLVGSFAGGAGGSWIGGKIWGEGSDGQKWAMLGGSVLGGLLGAKGGAWFDRNYTVTTEGLGSNLGNLKVVPRNAPLKTTPLDPHYIGEEIPNNPRSWTRGAGPVRYLSDSELQSYRVEIKDGKLYGSDGKLFDTTQSATWDGQQKAIYVMDKNGQIYASTEQRVFEFHHSSLGQGKPVAGAGEIEVENGELMSINNRSGHYRPSTELLEQSVKELESQGVDMSNVIVEAQ